MSQCVCKHQAPLATSVSQTGGRHYSSIPDFFIHVTVHTAIVSLRRTGTQSYNHLLFLPAAYTALCESFESSLSLASLHAHHARCGDKLFPSPLHPSLDVTVLTSIIFNMAGSSGPIILWSHAHFPVLSSVP